MVDLTLRAAKASPLTNAEVDANFTNLDDGKWEASVVAASASKATPVDADALPMLDSATSNGLKKLTWANLKATLKAYFDTLYAATARGMPAGGTTGQVLTKTSSTNNDAAWADSSSAQTGDVLLSARNPGAGWLQAGSVYLQSAYPALYALVGTIANSNPTKSAATSLPSSIYAEARISRVPGINRLVINLAETTGGGARITYTSYDGGGSTWGPGVVLPGPTNFPEDVLIWSQTSYSQLPASSTVISSISVGAANNTTSFTHRTAANFTRRAGLRFSDLIGGFHGTNGTARTFTRTTNGGTSFSEVSLPASGITATHGVVFSATVGMLFGSGTTAMRTTNAGAAFSSVTHGMGSVNLYDVVAVNETVGLALTNAGVLYRTTNAQNFSTNLGTFTGARSLAVLSERTVMLVGPIDMIWLNRPGFELTPRSWTVTMPPFRRYFSIGTPPD